MATGARLPKARPKVAQYNVGADSRKAIVVIMQAMEDRRLSSLDRLLSGLDSALRGVAAPASRASRPYPAAGVAEHPLSETERRHSGALMRVNHAGEVAAQGLYQGHAAVARSRQTATHMRAAADEERDHLAWCEQRLAELGSGPSRLRPAWYAGAWLIGAASGMLGDRWSLGFVAETERQVSEHLDSHLERLPAPDARSRALVRQMREEEARHGHDATRAGGARLPEPVRGLMRAASKLMTTTAYRL